MEYLLPGFTAQNAIDRPDLVVAANSPSRNPLRLRPPVTSAMWCGPLAQRYCSTQSAQDYMECGRIDCERLCDSAFPSQLCDNCLAQRRACREMVLARYADCGSCTGDATCQADITTSPGGGYSYCCPPGRPPCGGACTRTSCGIGRFDTDSCECDCPEGGGCLDDDGRVTDCCDQSQQCLHGNCCDEDRVCDGICCDGDRHCDAGHCCPVGQRWVDGRCCDQSKICRRPPGSATDPAETCCSAAEECAPDPRYPGLGHCCPAGKIWCQGSYLGGCCEPDKCCGNACCTAGQHCSDGHCCPAGQEWAFSRWIGYGSAAEGSCCPATGKPRTWCGSPATGFRCCDSDRCCDGVCCPPGQQCSNDHCCPAGKIWCGATCCDPVACCPDGVCADLANDPAHCGSCPVSCDTDQGQRCQNGHCVCAGGRQPCGGRCCAQDEICTAGVCSIPCGTVQESGHDAPVRRTINLGSTAGFFKFAYDTHTIRDRIYLRSQGTVLLDTGCVGKSDAQCFWHSGTPATVEVEVVPNCDGTTGTDWEYSITCPIFSSQLACIVG